MKRLEVINDINQNIVTTHQNLSETKDAFEKVMASLVLLRTFQEEILEKRYDEVVVELEEIKNYLALIQKTSQPSFVTILDKKISSLIEKLKEKSVW